jgi:mono/diheme cytochrome c family protein
MQVLRVSLRIVVLLPCVLIGGIAASACDVPTPLAPAAPIGEVPRWGEGFATPSQIKGGSMMGPMMGGSGDDGAGGVGNTGLPAGTKSPGATGDWGGGDANLGKGLYVTMCARCHGESGEGGQIPGGTMATALNDPKWQAATEDRIIARTVMLGKGAMPSFMSQGLDKPKLQGIVAYVRTLKKQ